jgi:hypothetical protein
MIKHFEWWQISDGESASHGRVAVGVDTQDRFRFAQIAGQAPVPEVLYKALAEMPEILEESWRIDKTRVHRAGVEIRHGMSGCVDILLREERDIELCDYPIKARIHVSMAGKINQPVKLWLGDLPRLLEVLKRQFPIEPADFPVYIGEVPLFSHTEIFDAEVEVPYEPYLSTETLERLRRIQFEDDDCEGGYAEEEKI